MTSEIRTNSLTSRAGLSTVTLTDSGPMFSGITTFVDNSGFNLGTGSSIFTPASNTLTFGTNNLERVRIKNDGKVGIGTNNPTAKLEIKGSDNPLVKIVQDTSGIARLNLESATNDGYQYSGIGLGDGTNDAELMWTTAGFDINVGNSVRLRINSNGAWGAGTNFGSSGQVLTSQGSSSAPTWTTISGTTINNNANNRLITGSGTANTLEGEANLTYNGSILHNQISAGARNDFSTSADGLIIEKGGNTGLSIDPGSSGVANIYFPNESNHSIASISHNNSNGELRVRGEDHIILSTNNNTERLRINSSGNARLGGSSNTTDQGYRLTLQGSANATYLQFFDNGTGTTHGSDGTFIGLINQDFYVYNRETKNIIFGANNNERLRITSGGDTELRNTTASISNTYSQYLKFRTTQTNGQSAVTGQIAGQGRSNWGGDLVFYSKPANGTPNDSVTERLRIQSNGTIKLSKDGTTVGDNVSGVLIIGRHDSNNEGGEISFCRSNDNSAYWHFDCYGNGNGPRLRFHRAGSERFNFFDNGNFTYTGTISSDRDLKEDIQPVTGTSIDKVIQLTPKSFKYIGNDMIHTGFIAQEVKEVWPSLANGTDGNKDMGVDYNGIVAHLVNCVKEQQDQFNKQQEQIKVLTQENISLRARVTNLEGN